MSWWWCGGWGHEGAASTHASARLGMTVSERLTVLFSGGLDSTALCVFYRAMGLQPNAVFIEYGQASQAAEALAVRAITDRLAMSLKSISLAGVIPPDGAIFGRNAFLVFTALLECNPSRGGILGLGIHSGTAYVDCGPAFVTSVQSLLDLYSGGTVRLDTPFIGMTKSEIAVYLRDSAPDLIPLTHSCERSNTLPCGRCASCLDRERIDATTSL